LHLKFITILDAKTPLKRVLSLARIKTRFCHLRWIVSLQFITFSGFVELLSTTIFSMDRESVYTLGVGLGSTDEEADSRSKIQQQLIDFILEFRVDNQYIYRYTKDISW
jgi:hypothetical protein